MQKEDYKEILKKRSLKATNNRLNLLNELDAFKSAMPYSAIQDALQPIDRVTLYRTLDVLVEKGVIHKAYQENNEVFYAICSIKCTSKHHFHDHIHFKCNQCGIVSCEDIEEKIKISLPKFEIEKIAVNVSGVCATCLSL